MPRPSKAIPLDDCAPLATCSREAALPRLHSFRVPRNESRGSSTDRSRNTHDCFHNHAMPFGTAFPSRAQETPQPQGQRQPDVGQHSGAGHSALLPEGPPVRFEALRPGFRRWMGVPAYPSTAARFGSVAEEHHHNEPPLLRQPICMPGQSPAEPPTSRIARAKPIFQCRSTSYHPSVRIVSEIRLSIGPSPALAFAAVGDYMTFSRPTQARIRSSIRIGTRAH